MPQIIFEKEKDTILTPAKTLKPKKITSKQTESLVKNIEPEKFYRRKEGGFWEISPNQESTMEVSLLEKSNETKNDNIEHLNLEIKKRCNELYQKVLQLEKLNKQQNETINRLEELLRNCEYDKRSEKEKQT